MTAPTVEPDTRTRRAPGERLFHFACVVQRAAAGQSGALVRCLCGHLQGAAARPGRKGRPGPRCVVCLDLEPAHLAECQACRAAVGR